MKSGTAPGTAGDGLNARHAYCSNNSVAENALVSPSGVLRCRTALQLEILRITVRFCEVANSSQVYIILASCAHRYQREILSFVQNQTPKIWDYLI